MKPWGCIQSIMGNVELASVRIEVESWKNADLTPTWKQNEDFLAYIEQPNMEAHVAFLTNSDIV